MGHGPECWCDRHKKARYLTDKTGAAGRVLTYGSSESYHVWGDPNAAEAQTSLIVQFITSMKAKSGASSSDPEMGNLRTPSESAVTTIIPDTSPASSPIGTPGTTDAPFTVPEVEDNAESVSSDEDAVMITPMSEGTDFGFQRLVTPSPDARFELEGLEVIEGISVDSDSDSDWLDDEWTSISGRLHFPRLSSFSTTCAVSDASVQTSNAPMIVSLAPVTIPSPPQTPPTQAYQAHVSDVSKSETD
ncbi:hypothetical protein N0V91_006512 [Didymella pomorum]|uniref:Uncharacterized protein n=1 Tax=Didymella pomorum TaxID=749634 RepID=A0A9W8ZCL1_9PLEO|nr:hypothetical protein N0V91_006512 [Didymella pomorum]